MLRLPLIAVLLLLCPTLLAQDYSWPLDSADAPEFGVHGEVTGAPGVEGVSSVFDGASLLKAKDSERLTGGTKADFVLAEAHEHVRRVGIELRQARCAV